MNTVRVFVSYAHEDILWIENGPQGIVPWLAKALRPRGVEFWYDNELRRHPGPWEKEIRSQIEKAHFALLLISQDFEISEFIRNKELPWIRERAERNELMLLPVLVGPLGRRSELLEWIKRWQLVYSKTDPLIECLNDTGRFQRAKVEILDDIRDRIDTFRMGKDRALVSPGPVEPSSKPEDKTDPSSGNVAIEVLKQAACLTDQMWTVPAQTNVSRLCGGTRGLGAPQADMCRSFRLGSHLNVIIDSPRSGYLTLVDEGPENIYCLCPSRFAPDTRVMLGRCILPQAASPYPSFVVSGFPGREHLLAMVSDTPLPFDWMPDNPVTSARVLTPPDINRLADYMHGMEVGRWIALATYFDIVA